MAEEDRRRKKRSIPKNHLMALIGQSAGTVKDISMSGIGFEYSAERKEDYALLTKVDLLLPAYQEKLKNILCEVIYDVVVKPGAEDPAAGSPLTARRCGVRLGPLLNNQPEELKRFLEQNTQ